MVREHTCANAHMRICTYVCPQPKHAAVHPTIHPSPPFIVPLSNPSLRPFFHPSIQKFRHHLHRASTLLHPVHVVAKQDVGVPPKSCVHHALASRASRRCCAVLCLEEGLRLSRVVHTCRPQPSLRTSARTLLNLSGYRPGTSQMDSTS